jgi:hypothetical protein
VVMDTDNDGDYDTAAVDTDHDGTYETVSHDANGFA